MLLSIDRVLQLVSDGKSLEKIAEMAQCQVKDVVNIIEDARALLIKSQKQQSRKKVILKKPRDNSDKSDTSNSRAEVENAIFNGAEFSTIPLKSTLTFYISGYSKSKTGPSGIGIVIHDKEDHQIGKVSTFIGNTTDQIARFHALLRAMKIAEYFEAHTVRFRTDSEFLIKQLEGEVQVTDTKISHLISQIKILIKKINTCKIELVPKTLNDKSEYFAEQGALSINKK